MPAQKRSLDESSSSHKVKKSKTEDSHKTDRAQQPSTSSLLTEEVDFPRGGGTSFTPLEVKSIRAEAVREANAELIEDARDAQKSNKRKRKSETKAPNDSKATQGKDRIRIEHLNYKRINVGMKIFGQIVTILPLALIVSLPNQLYAHVPITNISSQFTELLERMDQELDSVSEENDEEEENEASKFRVPELAEIFKVGQYVCAVVSAVHAPGASDVTGVGRSRDETSRASRRIELSLVPERVNAGVQKSDLQAGFTLTGAVKSREDHGYIIDFGIQDVSGFLSLKDAAKGRVSGSILPVGLLLGVTITKVSTNGRIFTVSADHTSVATSCLSEVSSVSSILPGTLVQALVTTAHSTGLNLQVLGFFEGTVDPLHLRQDGSAYKVGKKVKARILYDYSSSPPKFALSLKDHVVKLGVCQTFSAEEPGKGKNLQEAYPIGTLLQSVKVVRAETERGLIVEVDNGIEGFVHISHTSDDHVPSLSTSGPWKPGSIHPARVTGYFLFDGLLQLSLKPSVIQQKYLQVSDVEVGEVVKGTIKKLADSGLFVSLSGGVDGVVWPNHYADIVLKHPAKRFKEGASIKCRVLVVDPERKRISLTAKKTLVDSTFPILSKIEDITPGMITHAVVFKVHEKHLLVEFYNNLKAVVPAKEISDSPKGQLPQSFPIGRVVRVRILGVNEGRITASIRQTLSTHNIVSDISSIEIGHTVEGTVTEIHKDNVVLTLQPSHIRALLSLKNLANHRSLSLPQLRINLKVGEKLDELVVVTRNPEKAIVIVANKPRSKPSLLLKGNTITMESIKVGELIGGRITRHTPHGALVKITAQIGGILHITEISDNFDTGVSFPAIDTIIKATVIAIDQAKRQLTLSTRPSRMYPDQVHEIIDPEIGSIADIQVGTSLRGFVKNVGEHGLFVTIGRGVDARVQIRELFDEYVKDWQSRFQVNQLVKGRILSVDVDTKKAEMTFKSGDLSARHGPSKMTLSDLREGLKVDGVVTKIEDFGLFIQIEGSKLSGLCHKSQLSDTADADVALALQGFRAGDRVKAIILGIDNRRISLGLKPSYFTEEDLQGEDVDSDGDEEHEGSFGVVQNEEQSEEEEQDDDMAASDGESDQSMDVDVDEAQIEYQHKKTSKGVASKPTPVPQMSSLSLAGGFQWSGDVQQVDENEEADSSSDDDEAADEPSKKKRKRKAIEQDLTAEMHTKTPESNADFERLLLGSPNSSYLWIQYMSFQLPLSEVDKAREIARRAIRTINFREEQEKMNVWMALLNLENVYGTDESLDLVFKEAARANDSKTIHLKLASVLEQSDKHEKAEEQYKRTCKKFGQSSKVWTLFGEFYLRKGNLEDARKLLPRSLQSLEKRKHLKTISRFAQLEYKYGDAERGKTLFEGIVDSHPKRWDMWSVYMDMEATQSNIQSLRNIFERVLALKMTSHKAKSFFKKWLELEKRIGDQEGAETVKEKAIEWTQRASNAS
ncbi:hypothetical protein B0H34DRAFT_645870 [Crassisporium funariophilum]|nr:hypothetical protein B0H34DRAFT_645870 [Crassisporium funariophilum]